MCGAPSPFPSCCVMLSLARPSQRPGVCVCARAQVQTDDVEALEVDEAAFSFEAWAPPPDIVAFLRRVEPKMNAQLEKNATSHAFDGACFVVASLSTRLACSSLSPDVYVTTWWMNWLCAPLSPHFLGFSSR